MKQKDIIYCCAQKYFTLTVYADKRIVIKKEDMRDKSNPCVGELTLMWEELPCVIDLLKIA